MKFRGSLTAAVLLASALVLSQASARLFMHGGGGNPAPAAGVVEVIQLCSTSGSLVAANTPSPPMFGLEFKKGDIPAGQYPMLQATDGAPWPATFINVRHWSDGSMKILGVLPGPFPKAIPTGCINANVLSGGSAPAASGLTPTQLYSELMQVNANGFAGALGTGLSFTGNWSAKLANDANNAEIVSYGDGGGGRVYRILTHVQQSGTAHHQMEVYWYVQQLKDASGGVAGYRVLPRLTQPWYNVDSPAKDWRGLQTFNIQYGAGPTTITPPYPAADNSLTLSASNYLGGTDWTTTTSTGFSNCGSSSQQTCPFIGYVTADGGGTLPAGLPTNTLVCGEMFLLVPQFRFEPCATGTAFTITNGGTGTFTFHPVRLLPHFGSLWGARADGRYTYVQGSGTVVADAPILVKGNPVYEQSTKLWPPFDMSLTPNPNASTFYGSGSAVQWDPMTVGPVIQNTDQGGERDEIGARNAWCSRAFFSRTLDDDKWVRLLGLVQKQFPANMRDVTTRNPINLADPANTYTGFPASLATTVKWSGIEGTAGFTAPLHGGPSIFGLANDNSHMTDFSGCAYLMTGEPQYLDQQLEWANQVVSSRSPTERNPVIGGTPRYAALTNFSGWGVRLMAWSLRALVDVDAWWPDVDPTGAQTHAYVHDLEQATTGLPQITLASENSWAQTNCFWVPGGGSGLVFWMMNYMNTVMGSAYNAAEDANGLWFLNCSATWAKHLLSTYGNGFMLYASDEKAFDTGELGSSGSLDYLATSYTWSGGVATVTLADPTKTAALFDGEQIYVTAGGFTGGPYTLTRTSTTTATFPLVSNPGAPASGLFQAVGTTIDSDDKFSIEAPPPINLYQFVWQSGTPGSFAEAYAVNGLPSWNPANGDKIIFSPYIPTSTGIMPGGLLSAKPYWAVNMHTGSICGMGWSGGTLTVTTCAPHGLTIGESRVVGFNETDAAGLQYAGHFGPSFTPGPFVPNCQATGISTFTCPVASDPGIGVALGKFNTANLSASVGGSPLAMTDTNSTDPNHWPGYLPANPPANYWVDYPFYAGYLAVALDALHTMRASGVTGLEGYEADASFRLNSLLTFFGESKNQFYSLSPKYGMQCSFGGAGTC